MNLAPDSFYDGGRYSTQQGIMTHVEKMLGEGASIIDVGAVSTRPKADLLTQEEEMNRLFPTLKQLVKEFPGALFSVDTFRSEVARQAVEKFGVAMINDISGGTLDSEMFSTIALLQVPYVLMHIQGTPQNMQDDPVYANVVSDIMTFFSEKIAQLDRMGVNDVIIDPGFGFGKTIDHNFAILRQLDQLKIFGLPVLTGLSRKSMIYRTLGSGPNDSLNGTTVLNTLALAGGANILRVHDVKEAIEAIKIFEKYKQ